MTHTRSSITRALALSLVLVVLGAPSAGAWTGTTVASQFELSRPSLRVDGADHTGIAFERDGESPGIIFASDAGGPWATTRISSGDDWTPALAYDGSDHAHVLFARGNGTPGIYETTDATGSWATPSLVANDNDAWSPALAVDGADHLHAVYTSIFSSAPGLYYLSNATGSWVKTRITPATWASEADLVLDASGHAHVVFARYAPESSGIYYATNATGSWAVTRISTAYDDSPSLVLDGSSKVHVAFSRFGGGTRSTYHATNATGPWVVTQLPPYLAAYYGATAIGYDGAGRLTVWAAQWAADTINEMYSGIYDWTLDNGTWEIARTATDGPILSDDNPSMDTLADGTVRLAFDRALPTAGIRAWDGAAGSSLVAGGLLAIGPAIDLGPTGTRHVAYERRNAASHTIVHASSTGSAWSSEDAGSFGFVPGAADIAAAADGSVRIVDGDAYWSNATGSWVSDTSLSAYSEPGVEVDATGHTHIVYSSWSNPYWFVSYRTDASGSWADEWVLASSFDTDPTPALALDSSDRPNVVFDYNDGDLVYVRKVNGSWTSPSAVTTSGGHLPALAIDAAGKAHVAYLIGGGASPGVWYATNTSGKWVRTRLTRSTVDGPPSIALDGAGHVYVATTRGDGAANPGIYVATNATGAWSVQRAVTALNDGPVSLAMAADGSARMVVSTTDGIVAYETGPGLTALMLRSEAARDAVERTKLEHSIGRWAPAAGAAGVASHRASTPTSSGAGARLP